MISSAFQFLSNLAYGRGEDVADAYFQGKAEAFSAIRDALPEDARERSVLLTHMLAESMDELQDQFPGMSTEQMSLVLGGLILVQKEAFEAETEPDSGVASETGTAPQAEPSPDVPEGTEPGVKSEPVQAPEPSSSSAPVPDLPPESGIEPKPETGPPAPPPQRPESDSASFGGRPLPSEGEDGCSGASGDWKGGH